MSKLSSFAGSSGPHADGDGRAIVTSLKVLINDEPSLPLEELDASSIDKVVELLRLKKSANDESIGTNRVQELKDAFFRYARFLSTEGQRSWEVLRTDPIFMRESIEYIQRTLSELLQQKPVGAKNGFDRQTTVYDEIEFFLFILGTNEQLDVLEDLKTNDCFEFSNLMRRYRKNIERSLKT
jgi:hypothetical protein